MGKRGPKPTPTRILKLRGSPLAGRRDGELLAQSAGEFDTTPPPDLAGDALAEWERLVPILSALGVLTPLDRSALHALCERWEAYTACVKLKDSVAGSWQEEAALSNRLNGALDRWMKIAAAFGLTPSDRTRLRIDPPTPRLVGAGRFKMVHD